MSKKLKTTGKHRIDGEVFSRWAENNRLVKRAKTYEQNDPMASKSKGAI
ncbi:hypothetical protein ACOI1C_19830 [Bacillus sp. DJP31]